MVIPAEDGVVATTSGIEISNILLNQLSLTSVEVSVYTDLMTLIPDSISIYYIEIDPTDGSAIGSASSPEIFTYESDGTSVFKCEVLGLAANKKYSFYVKAKKGSGYSTELYKDIQLSSQKTTAKVTTAAADANNSIASKGFLIIDAPVSKNKYEVLTRKFNAIELPIPTSVSSQGVLYGDTYYTFGTSIFFEPVTETKHPAAGFGFFTNEEGSQGYFILVETTALSASQNRKSIRIVKTNGSEMYTLKDSQVSLTTTFDGLYGGAQYNLDIKVKLSGINVDIDVYINGYRISATDTGTASSHILTPTQNISVIAANGKSSFDYVYGSKIEKYEYDNFVDNSNFYQGQFSNDLLNTSYGNLFYEDAANQDLYTKRKEMVDEFGITVREIQKYTAKFDSRPAFPIFWTTGANKFAKIIASKYSNFGGEAYVLNNTSTTIPLADDNGASFYIYGNTLSNSGQLEYSTDLPDTTYNTKEPITFQSKWIQSEHDAKNLADWIKSNVVNKGKLVNMEIFGNPIISVGDIVSIKYDYQGFSGLERLIVSNITHSFNGGLSTNISCRVI